eukprot:TRINITY_DN901_c0_g5_i1.p1 TRINITY_DN901_c0_g5~~TRINITY_DN901_c0_g5_i1.p1  ORF type:complete len:257 (-),score=35.43 TRINITY_DN901_c0_g5_i1:924-1694(-)
MVVIDIKSAGYCGSSLKNGYCLLSCGACDRLSEYYALSAFRDSISVPSQLSSWEGWGICSTWDGIICENHSVANITLTDVVDTVHTSIPKQFSLLTVLKKLEVSAGSLLGTIPKELSVLNNLLWVDLSKNAVSGSFPMEVSCWKSMNFLNMTANSITGTLPSEISNWKSVQGFSFGKNKIRGTLPSEYSAWTKLKYNVYLEDTQLSGTIPREYSDWKGVVVSFIQNPSFELCGKNDLCVPSSYQKIPAAAKCPICK